METKFLPPIAPFGWTVLCDCGVWLGVNPTTNTKRHVFKKDWTAHSKFVNHSTGNNQHNREDLYDHLMSMSIFTLIMNETFIWAPEIVRGKATATIRICYSFRSKCKFHIRQEVGAELKVTMISPHTLLSYLPHRIHKLLRMCTK